MRRADVPVPAVDDDALAEEHMAETIINRSGQRIYEEREDDALERGGEDAPAALVATHMSKKFFNQVAVYNYSLVLNEGQTAAIIGPNGSVSVFFLFRKRVIFIIELRFMFFILLH